MATAGRGRQTGRVADLIDDYVAAVGRGLCGSGRMRADMLAEVRDALVDATDGYRACGLAAGEAQLLAVAEFGPACRVSAGLQDVLAVVHGRRAAWSLLVVLGVHYAISEYVARSTGWQRMWGGGAPGAAYLWLAQATDTFIVVALAAAAALVVVFGWVCATSTSGGGSCGWAAVLVSAVVGVTLLSGTLLTVLAPRGGAVALVEGELWWAVPFAVVLRAAWRCWRAAIG